MSITKESLLECAADCRRMLNAILDNRKAISSAVGETRRNLKSAEELVENAPSSVNDGGGEEKIYAIDSTIAKLERSLDFMQGYKKDMEEIRNVHEKLESEISASALRLDRMLMSAEQMAAMKNSSSDGETTDSTTLISAENKATSSATTNELIRKSSSAKEENTTSAHQIAGNSSTPPSTSPKYGSSDNEINASASADDPRKWIVSKGNANPDELCQRSIQISKNPMQCVISHLESPSLFWVQLSTLNQVEEIEDQLNREPAADDPESELVREFDESPKVGDYCAAPIDRGQDLRRAKILEIKPNKAGVLFAKILYVDYGQIDWVSTKALLTMPRSLRKHNLRQACPCALSEVEPISGVWDENVINAFRELCADEADDNSYLAVKSLDDRKDADIHTVSLYRVNKRTMEEVPVVTRLIARAMREKCLLRRVDPIVPTPSFEKAVNGNSGVCCGIDPPEDSDGWRFDVRIIARPVVVVAESTAVPSNAAPKPPSPPTIVEGTVHSVALPNRIPPSKDGCFHFQITRAVSPGEFYIQLRDEFNRNPRLDALTEHMGAFYANPSHRFLLRNTQAQFAAVPFPIVNGQCPYRRVFVTDWKTNEEDTISAGTRDIRMHSNVNALFIDDGFEARIQTRGLVILDKMFCLLPPQAARCKLHDCSPAWGADWDDASMDIFQELCQCQRALMKGFMLSDEEPYELIVFRLDQGGAEICVNAKMVQSGRARSNDTMWS